MIKAYEIIRSIKYGIINNLPGRQSHVKMAPIANNELFRPFDPPDLYKESGVLLPLFFDDDKELKIILTLRSNELKHHSGQISFPGGRREKEESLQETALRETWEEVGIESKDIEILGELSVLYVPPSNTIIHPFVGYIKELGDIRMNPDEVDEIILISVKDLIDHNNYRKEIWNFSGMDVEVPYWDIKHEVPLWGATAMILQEFVDIYEAINSL
jgi:8-oxo-dGTP pyrophosphatase MutT (NUDIX family)